MSSFSNPTGRTRLKPTIVKTGWFKQEIVFVLQEEIQCTGYGVDYYGIGNDYDYKKWVNVKAFIENKKD